MCDRPDPPPLMQWRRLQCRAERSLADLRPAERCAGALRDPLSLHHSTHHMGCSAAPSPHACGSESQRIVEMGYSEEVQV